MGTRDGRVDAYIAQSAAFAQPILKHLRALVHEACPDVEETIKWGMPYFMYHGILCGMAAFKRHAVFVVWRSSVIAEDDRAHAEAAMGQFGRITSLDDLPPDEVLSAYIREAAHLNRASADRPDSPRKREVHEPDVPDFLAAALAENERARLTFEGLTPGRRREYVLWLTEAKREETRQRRLQTALEWLAEGKPRDWKYMRP